MYKQGWMFSRHKKIGYYVQSKKILGGVRVIYLKFVSGISLFQIINLRSTSQQITKGPLISVTKASDSKRSKATSKILHPKMAYSPPWKLKTNRISILLCHLKSDDKYHNHKIHALLSKARIVVCNLSRL